jgi:hypothetical protein
MRYFDDLRYVGDVRAYFGFSTYLPAVLEGDKAAASVLLDLLDDSDEYVRAAAARGLAAASPLRTYPVGQAQAVRIGNLLVLVFGGSGRINGSDQCLTIVDGEGSFVDSLLCYTDCPVPGGLMLNTPDGILYTDVLDRPESDGAQFIIRCEKLDEISGEWNHEITLHGRSHRFSWDQTNRDTRFAEWMQKGLCRIAVRDGRFEVLWPPLEAGKEVLTQTRGSSTRKW